MHDALGNAITSSPAATEAGLNDFIEGFLAYEPRAVKVLEAADADPGSVLANVYAGALHMLAETTDAPANARRYLERAASAGPGLEREAAARAFLEAWIRDDIPAALRISRDVVEAHPRDLVMVKLHQYLQLNRGDFPGLLRVALGAQASGSAKAHLLGMCAFGYEQCHLLDAAETAAWKALELREAEPWAQHALAHVMITQGRIGEGARFMRSVSGSWSGLNSFMYTHNWWHLALFELALGRGEEALAIHDAHCWTQDRTYSQDQIGSASLLARLEFAGLDVADRWTDLADHVETRGADTVQPFLSLQYLLALGRAGRASADELLDAIRRRAADAPEHVRATWAQVALPAAEGVLCWCRGDDSQAVLKLGQALRRLVEIGGSHAQRDLFEQIFLQAVLRQRRWPLAQTLLEERRAFDPEGVPINLALARVYDELGLPVQAAEAAARARHTAQKASH